jgi:hypothetical protein
LWGPHEAAGAADRHTIDDEGKGAGKMRKITIMGSCLIVGLALTAVFAGTASAALPEFGRCVKVAPKSGEYSGARCVRPTPGKGSYDFIAGPGEKPKFTGSGGGVAFETVGKKTITCAGSEESGEYTGAKTLKESVNFIGCANEAGQSCQSNPAKTGEIENTSLEGEIGFIRGPEKPIVGLDLKGSPNYLTFICGALPETTITVVTIEGSVIAPIKHIDLMAEEFSLKYKQVGGKQVPEQFAGGAKDTLTANFASGLTKTTEQIGLTDFVEITNEEPIEIKGK